MYASSSLQSVNSLATLGGSFGAIIGLIPFNAYATTGGVPFQQDPNFRNLDTAIDPRYEARLTLLSSTPKLISRHRLR